MEGNTREGLGRAGKKKEGQGIELTKLLSYDRLKRQGNAGKDRDGPEISGNYCMGVQISLWPFVKRAKHFEGFAG
jgi:hypothetical protein